MMRLPTEILDSIAVHVEDPSKDDERYAIRCHQRYDNASGRRLGTLRHVCRAFYETASRRLFRHIRAKPPNPWTCDPHHPLEYLVATSQNPRAANLVREVDVSFEYLWRSLPQYQLYLYDLVVLLPLCLSKFPNLTALKMTGPSYTFLHSPSPALTIDMLRLLTRSMLNLLRYVPLPKLRDLTVSLPLASEFGHFFEDKFTATKVPIKHVMRQIVHLRVEVCDNAGGRDPSDTPLSSLKSAFPNRDYAHSMFSFVALARNVTSLHLSSTDILDLDGLNLRSLRRLRILYLENMSFSFSKIQSILGECKYNLTRLEFNKVELKTGSWSDVFMEISRLPYLEYFHISQSGYWRSSYWMGGRSHSRDLESQFPLDYHALGNVQRQVNAYRRSKQLPEISSGCYRWLNMKSLEKVLVQ